MKNKITILGLLCLGLISCKKEEKSTEACIECVTKQAQTNYYGDWSPHTPTNSGIYCEKDINEAELKSRYEKDTTVVKEVYTSGQYWNQSTNTVTTCVTRIQ